MAGEYQRLTVPVGGGLDNHTEPHLLAPEKSQFARNVTGRRAGGYEKVPGAALVGSPVVGDPGQLLTYGRRQLLALGRDGSAVLGDNGAWLAHPEAGKARPLTVEWVGALQVRGDVISVNLAHNAGYTAIVAMVARDVTVNPSTDIDDDLEAACVILDANDRVVWGPYYERGIRLWPRVEPLTSGAAPGFVFFGLEADLDALHGAIMTLRAFRVVSGVWAAPSTIIVDTLQGSLSASRRFLYDSHGAGDTDTAYIVYYSDTDASVVLNRIDGNTAYSPAVLAITRDGNYAVFHDTDTSTVLVYSEKAASIYAATEDLATVNTHAGAGTYAIPGWYEHNGNLYLNGMLVTQAGSSPSTPSFSGTPAHVAQSLDMDPHQLGTDGPVLWFHYPALWENGILDPIPVQYIELNAAVHVGTAGAERSVVVAPLLASRHNAQELLNVYDRGTVQYDVNIPQTDGDATGRVYVPWATAVPTAKPWEGMELAARLIDRNEGGPYNSDRVVGFVRLDYSDGVSRHSAVEHSGSLVLAAGEVYSFDGAVFVDIPGPPRITAYDDGAAPASYIVRTDVAAVDAFADNGVTTTQWFALKAVLVYTDRNGVEHRSAPSDAWFQNGIAANNDCPRIWIDVNETHRRVIDAGGGFDLELYTTIRSDPNDGTPLVYATGFANADDVVEQYYLAQRTPLQVDGSGYFVPDFMQFEYRGVYRPLDTTGDRVRPTRAAIPLYTDSGELAPIRPPASNVIAAAGGYAFLVPSEFPAELWPSKPLETGRAPEFHPNLRVTSPAGAGDIVALGAQGDRLILFCQYGVWELFVGGGGPDASGSGSFGALRKVHDGDACLGQRTVANLPQGVFFVSDSGPKVVTGNGVEDIGRLLNDLMDPSGVLDVAYHETSDEVWVIMSDGNHFVYDLTSGIWTDNQLLAKSAAYLDRKLYRLANTGQVFEEDTASSQDGSSNVLAQVTTGWINLGDVQGYKRLKRASMLMRPIAGTLGTVSIKLAFDYDDTTVDTFTWTASEYNAFERPGHFVVRPSRQKVSAVKLTFQEGVEVSGQSTVNNLRWSLAGFQLEVMMKAGLLKLQQEAKK